MTAEIDDMTVESFRRCMALQRRETVRAALTPRVPADNEGERNRYVITVKGTVLGGPQWVVLHEAQLPGSIPGRLGFQHHGNPLCEYLREGALGDVLPPGQGLCRARGVRTRRLRVVPGSPSMLLATSSRSLWLPEGCHSEASFSDLVGFRYRMEALGLRPDDAVRSWGGVAKSSKDANSVSREGAPVPTTLLLSGESRLKPSFAPEGFCLAEAEQFDFGLQLCAAGFELRSRFQESLAPLPVTNAHRLGPVMAKKPCQTRSQQGS